MLTFSDKNYKIRKCIGCVFMQFAYGKRKGAKKRQIGDGGCEIFSGRNRADAERTDAEASAGKAEKDG